ncbi:MAG: hypothetical protein PHI72_07355 [Atribacterota bacterium]|jgi:hypothetical protein|nr:hypothetical protein [Atribacterota bacterium]MDD4895252.1 hypothetical protein [Atribacterota bacterium]MDD5637569.1 hypothetical protein [Atribacterota bacterium]
MKKLSIFITVVLVFAFLVIQPVSAVEVIRCGHGHSTTHPVHLGFEYSKN